MEQLQLGTFADAMFQSRNAEEGLLVALHACARVTRRVSLIEHPDPTSFGAWFRRIQGQRTGSQSALAASCLSFLNLSGIRLDIGDFYGADFQYSDLTNVGLHYATLISSRLEGADLQDALLIGSNLEHAYVRAAHLQRARLDEARLMRADFEGADLEGAFLRDANVVGTNFASANLKGVALDDIRGANLEGVRLPKNVRFEDISSRKKSQH